MNLRDHLIQPTSCLPYPLFIEEIKTQIQIRNPVTQLLRKETFLKIISKRDIVKESIYIKEKQFCLVTGLKSATK